jgi:peptide/nickel transport system ATP-binding protein
VGEAILEPMRVHGIGNSEKERKIKALELLERVNMNPSQFNRYPHEFSGGQRQRICIARALALNPEFIVCDECISSLDVSVQAQVINLLSELKNDFGFTYLFISHDISVVKFISDRMLVLYNGKIEEAGDADEVCFNPQKEYTKQLINAVPKGRVKDIKLHRRNPICQEPPHRMQ